MLDVLDLHNHKEYVADFASQGPDQGSGTLLVRLYKDNALILGHLPQSAHLTNFERL